MAACAHSLLSQGVYAAAVLLWVRGAEAQTSTVVETDWSVYVDNFYSCDKSIEYCVKGCSPPVNLADPMGTHKCEAHESSLECASSKGDRECDAWHCVMRCAKLHNHADPQGCLAPWTEVCSITAPEQCNVDCNAASHHSARSGLAVGIVLFFAAV